MGVRSHCNVLINISTVSTIGAASTIAVETIVLVITWRRTYRVHKEAKALGFPTSFATLLLVDGTPARFPGFRLTHPCSLGTVYLLVLILTQTANIASNVTQKVNCLPFSSPSISHTPIHFTQLYVWYYFTEVYVALSFRLPSEFMTRRPVSR